MPSLPAIEKDVEEKAKRAGDHGAFDAPATGEHDAAMFDPAQDKIYRHPTFYDIPDDVKHI